MLPFLWNKRSTIRETRALSIDGAAGIEGYLYIVLGGEEYDSAAEMLQGSFILRLSTGLASGGLLVTLLGGLVLFNLLTRRLRFLAVAMDRFRRSRYTELPDRATWAPRENGDEIDQLGLSFEQMSKRIGDQMRELEEKDELRRTLVANVSHDLQDSPRNAPWISRNHAFERRFAQSRRAEALPRDRGPSQRAIGKPHLGALRAFKIGIT